MFLRVADVMKRDVYNILYTAKGEKGNLHLVMIFKDFQFIIFFILNFILSPTEKNNE